MSCALGSLVLFFNLDFFFLACCGVSEDVVLSSTSFTDVACVGSNGLTFAGSVDSNGFTFDESVDINGFTLADGFLPSCHDDKWLTYNSRWHSSKHNQFSMIPNIITFWITLTFSPSCFFCLQIFLPANDSSAMVIFFMNIWKSRHSSREKSRQNY